MKTSSGLLMYSNSEIETKLFVAHPGGPFWKHKDNGSWSIPKGEINEGEDSFQGAKREFFEETGIKPPESNSSYLDLGSVNLKSGKKIHIFAFRGTGKETFLSSNSVEIKNKKTGKIMSFPEVDRAEYFTLSQAKEKLHPAYLEIIERLKRSLQKN